MRQIEPTYLRYIYDSLSLNTIHKDNISALPEGLIGMYEEAFSNVQNVSSRELFLNFFAAWSLLKKEVSTSLMANLLGWEEWEVIDFLSVYTKWFNSPASGKYLLYHERLRVFFLQKISSHQLDQTNHTIISKCQSALEKRNGDEWEVYALEYLPSHLLIAAMQSEADGVVFKKLVYDISFWNRQIEINKGYDWSKRMLNQAMTWAAKQNTDELIECALNKIDLHHMEQNDAPRIVELVANNDIETALQRIESFGGNDKEGLQRKFILYMLCLMELTLLDSKDKPWSKEAIEKILKHFDENMPIDHSVLNWNDFFPSYLIYLMAFEWVVNEIDYLLIYKRTKKLEINWIPQKGLYTEIQFKVFINSAFEMSQDREKIIFLIKISSQYFRQNMYFEASEMLNKSIDSINSILELSEKSYLFRCISSELLNQDKKTESLELLKKSKIIADKISKDVYQSSENKDISIQMISLGQISEAISIAKNIKYLPYKIEALNEISTQLFFKNYIVLANQLIQDSKELINDSKNDRIKIRGIISIATSEAKQGKISEALSTISHVGDTMTRDFALNELAIAVAEDGKNLESIEIASKIVEKEERTNVLNAIQNIFKISSKESNYKFENKEDIKEYYKQSIKFVKYKNSIIDFSKIIELFIEKDKLNEAIKLSKITGYSIMLNEICNDLIKKGKISDALLHFDIINDLETKCNLLKSISNEFEKKADNNKSEEYLYKAIDLAKKITNESTKSLLLSILSTSSFKKGFYDLSNSLLNESVEYANKISIKSKAISALIKVWKEILIQNKEKQADELISEILKLVFSMNNGYIKVKKLLILSEELFNKDYREAAKLRINEALINASLITSLYDKAMVLAEISSVYSEQNMSTQASLTFKKAFGVGEEITNFQEKNEIIYLFCGTLLAQGKIDQALNLSEDLSHELMKIDIFISITEKLFSVNDIKKTIKLLKRTTDILLDIKLSKSKKNNNYLDDRIVKLIIFYFNIGDYETLEYLFSKINQNSFRLKCWLFISETICNNNNASSALKHLQCFKEVDSKKKLIKGWTDFISLTEVSSELVENALPLYNLDFESMEILLQKYALNKVFFENVSSEKLNRLNRSLNIQWALDITNNFNQN